MKVFSSCDRVLASFTAAHLYQAALGRRRVNSARFLELYSQPQDLKDTGTHLRVPAFLSSVPQNLLTRGKSAQDLFLLFSDHHVEHKFNALDEHWPQPAARLGHVAGAATVF